MGEVASEKGGLGEGRGEGQKTIFITVSDLAAVPIRPMPPVHFSVLLSSQTHKHDL